MRVKESFNHYAINYQKFNIVQEFLAKHLVSFIKDEKKIIDLGCGEGSIYRALREKKKKVVHFVGVDFSSHMLQLHPKARNVLLIEGNFNQKELFKKLYKYKNYTIVSSSALQWAHNLDFTFKECAKVSQRAYFLLFTNNTFKKFHQMLSINSPIFSKAKILRSFKKFYYLKEYEEIKIFLKFNNTLDMLRYINKSGISGGVRVEVAKVLKLVKHYPYNFLEFEAILLKGVKKIAL